MTAIEYREHRKALGLTQQGLADALGVTRATVNSREGGRVKLSPEMVMAIRSLSKRRARK